jgi:hypothetical protein
MITCQFFLVYFSFRRYKRFENQALTIGSWSPVTIHMGGGFVARSTLLRKEARSSVPISSLCLPSLNIASNKSQFVGGKDESRIVPDCKRFIYFATKDTVSGISLRMLTCMKDAQHPWYRCEPSQV